MERIGTKIRRMQDQMFIDAYEAQTYYERFRHSWNDRDFTQKQLAIYEELSFLISHMGWTAEYMAYCDRRNAENEKSLTAQALTI